MTRWQVLLLSLFLLGDWRSLSAQSAEEWQFERLYTRDGRETQGLLLSQRESTYEFAEILRPAGKPIYAVIRTVPSEKVLSYHPLPAAEKALLLERYVNIRNHALIESLRMEDVKLATVARGGTEYKLYDGPWFTMYSTADEATTRRSIVRIEQTFCAYRQLLPPRTQQVSSFQIYLFGSTREYRDAQKGEGLQVAHPAFFAPAKNMVMAGTDLDSFSQELERVTAENEREQKRLRELSPRFEETLAQTAAEMKRNGFASSEVEDEILRRRNMWNDQNKQVTKRLAEAERRNKAKFHEITAGMFRRLHHEAFHAYLENYVFPHDQFEVPRWLNEGLAQVFEYAQLDADTLRVDAPPPELLRQLKESLKGAHPLPLRELLSDDKSLLAAHDQRSGIERHYLYAWGLTYHLAFLHPKLKNQELEALVAPAAARSPIQRLEKLVNQPLADFEKQWRKDILELR